MALGGREETKQLRLVRQQPESTQRWCCDLAGPCTSKSPSFLPCFSAVLQERKAGGGGGGCNISVCVLHHFSPCERPETAGPINEDLWWRKLPGERVISRRDAALIASTACYWHLETVGLLPWRFIPCQPCVQGREERTGANPSPCAGIFPSGPSSGHFGLAPRCFAASTPPACPCRCVRKPDCLQPGSPELLLQRKRWEGL